MLQQNNYQLQHVRQEISRQVAFPEELSLTIDEAAAREMLAEINACSSDSDLQNLIYSMSRRRLNDLFGAVLVVSASEGELPVNRLLEIFRKRATLSLAQTAWAFYQRHYPNDRLDRVLSTLVKALSSQAADEHEKKIFIQELQSLIIDRNLPARLADRLHRQPEQMEKARHALDRSNESVSQNGDRSSQPVILPARNQAIEKFPLLTAYSTISNLSDQTQPVRQFTSGLSSYMIRLSIMPDTRFTAAFLLSFFLEASDKDIQLNGGLFLQALRLGSQTSHCLLMNRYLCDFRMSAQWQEINESILDFMGPTPDRKDAVIHISSTDTVSSKPDGFSGIRQDIRNRETLMTVNEVNQENRFRNEIVGTVNTQSSPKVENNSSSELSNGTEANTSDSKSRGFLGWLRGRKGKTETNDNHSVNEKTISEQSPATGNAADAIESAQPVPDLSIGFKPLSFDQLLKEPKTHSFLQEKPAIIDEQAKESSTETSTARALAELQNALMVDSGSYLRFPSGDSDDIVPTNPQDCWNQVDLAAVSRFRQWEHMHQIGLHNLNSPRKIMFYQQYSLDIDKVSRWDDMTLVVHFPTFILADYADEEDQVWYYDLVTYQMLSEVKFRRPALNKPETAVMSSRIAMLNETKDNIVRLQLDAVNLLYSRDFINSLRNADPKNTNANSGAII